MDPGFHFRWHGGIRCGRGCRASSQKIFFDFMEVMHVSGHLPRPDIYSRTNGLGLRVRVKVKGICPGGRRGGKYPTFSDACGLNGTFLHTDFKLKYHIN